MKKICRIAHTLCLCTYIAVFSTTAFASTSPIAIEDTQAEGSVDIVSSEDEKITKATKKQKKSIVELCKKGGWNVSKVEFKSSGDWFLTGNDLKKYQDFSKELSLSGDYFSNALIGTKKYSNNGKPYYVTFVIALSDEDSNEIVGAFIIPKVNKKSMKLNNMMSLLTKPSAVKKTMNKN